MGCWDERVADWNSRFPLDRWWRQRHGVAFRSPKHLKTSQLAIRFEFEEERLFALWEQELKKKQQDADEMAATGVWINPPTFVKTTEEEEKQAYDELDMDDLSQFDDPVEEQPEQSGEEDVTL